MTWRIYKISHLLYILISIDVRAMQTRWQRSSRCNATGSSEFNLFTQQSINLQCISILDRWQAKLLIILSVSSTDAFITLRTNYRRLARNVDHEIKLIPCLLARKTICSHEKTFASNICNLRYLHQPCNINQQIYTQQRELCLEFYILVKCQIISIFLLFQS